MRGGVGEFVGDGKFALVEISTELFVSGLGEDGVVTSLRSIGDSCGDTARERGKKRQTFSRENHNLYEGETYEAPVASLVTVTFSPQRYETSSNLG